MALPGCPSPPCDDRRVSNADGSAVGADQTEGQPMSGRTLILVAVFMALALMLALPVRSWLSQRTELESLSVDIDKASFRVQELQREQELWRSDLHVAAQARIRLNMVSPGEAGLIVLDTQEEDVVTPTVDVPTTWWGHLWQSVESSTGRPAQVAESASSDASG